MEPRGAGGTLVTVASSLWRSRGQYLGTGYRIGSIPRPNQHEDAAIGTGRNVPAKGCAISGDIHDQDGIGRTST